MFSLLVKILVVCVTFVVTIKFVFVNVPEIFPLGSEIGDVVYDLSVGYIAAFIFYLIDIWIPRKNEMKLIKNRISTPLSRLLHNMKEPIEEVLKTSEPREDFYKLTKETLMKATSRINMTDTTPAMKTFKLKDVTYFNYFLYQIDVVNEYINEIKTDSIKNDIELLMILDKIKESSFHIYTDVLNKMDVELNAIDMNNYGETLYEYYGYFHMLKNYMIKNNISLTIEGL